MTHARPTVSVTTAGPTTPSKFSLTKFAAKATSRTKREFWFRVCVTCLLVCSFRFFSMVMVKVAFPGTELMVATTPAPALPTRASWLEKSASRRGTSSSRRSICPDAPCPSPSRERVRAMMFITGRPSASRRGIVTTVRSPSWRTEMPLSGSVKFARRSPRGTLTGSVRVSPCLPSRTSPPLD